jgi:long-subunit acyl-CoA synthetase (AMP-forming)
VVKCLVLGKLEIWDGLNASHLSIPILQMPHYSDNLKLNEGDSWDKAMSCPPLENFAMPSFSDTWAIIFTSGTTGKPKGVEISYLNLHSFVKNQLIYNDLGAFDQFNTSYISYLPLNHIAEKVLIACIAIYSQSTIHFAENLTSFSQNLKDARPHIFFSVPRIYIKIKTSLESRLGKSLTFINSLPIIKHWFRKFLLKKIGLDRAFCVSGSAVLAKDIKQWYNDTLGLRIADIYGQSESLGVISMTPRGALDFGSVGKPIAGMQVKLSKDTQELLYKADWTMSGYYKEVAITQEVFDDDGFIRSGDQARISEDGKIYIIGRVKESFKTEKGKYIVPNILEQYFQSLEVFEHLCVLGFGLPQPILLLVVNPYAKEIEKSKLHDMLDLALTKANESLSNEEKISHIVVLDELWDAQNDMLTPTLKIKRNKVNERYLEQCQKWQQESSKIIFVHF